MPSAQVPESTLSVLQSSEEELYCGDMASGVAQGFTGDLKAVEKEFTDTFLVDHKCQYYDVLTFVLNGSIQSIRLIEPEASSHVSTALRRQDVMSIVDQTGTGNSNSKLMIECD